MRTAIISATLICLTGAASAAPEFSGATLERSAQVYVPNVEAMVFDDIASKLSAEAQGALVGLQLDIPLRASHAMNFYAHAPSRTIIVPINTLRFVDEYARVFAWFESQGCRTEYVLSYLAEAIGSDAPLPGPLDAFGLTVGILDDHYTDDVSQKVLKSIVYYALAHEVGHILYGHAGGADGPHSVTQEIEADEVAIEVFRQTGAPPAGAVFYFFAAQFLDHDGPDATHPVSSDRIERIAASMRADPASFAWAEPVPAAAEAQVLSLAAELDGVAEVLRDPAFRRDRIAALRQTFPRSDWASACPE